MSFHSPESAPARDVAMVLGCALARDGTPSAFLADRLATAVALLRAGKVRRVLASGGPEAPAMGAHLAALGVDPDRIVVDAGGVRTFESFVRARDVHDVRAFLVVTHAYHLPRALYLGRAMGLDVDGVAAFEERTAQVRARTMLRNRAREVVATVRAVVDVAVLERTRVRGLP